MMKIATDEEVLTLTQAAAYAHVTRQAIYVAVRSGRMKAHKENGHWRIAKTDIDEYRLNKYNRDERQMEGEFLYDLEKGTYSMHQAAKILGQMLHRPYSLQRLYHMVRAGKIKANRRGWRLIITREELLRIFETESAPEFVFKYLNSKR